MPVQRPYGPSIDKVGVSEPFGEMRPFLLSVPSLRRWLMTISATTPRPSRAYFVLGLAFRGSGTRRYEKHGRPRFSSLAPRSYSLATRGLADVSGCPGVEFHRRLQISANHHHRHRSRCADLARTESLEKRGQSTGKVRAKYGQTPAVECRYSDRTGVPTRRLVYWGLPAKAGRFCAL